MGTARAWRVQEWEAAELINAVGNQSAAHTISSSRVDHGKLCISSTLWRTWMREPLVPCGDGHGFHTSKPLCTGVCAVPVGDVGSWEPKAGARRLISKSPELHSHNLENSLLAQIALSKPLRRDFHFSCLTYGDYCLFLLSIYSFPPPPSLRDLDTVERRAAPHKTAASTFTRIQRPTNESSVQTWHHEPCSGQYSRKPPHRSGNSEKCPAFPPTPGSRR
jgi:hypothetical protein